MKGLLKRLISRFKTHNETLPNRSDFSQEEWEIYFKVRPYTMTSHEKIITLIRSVKYIVDSGIKGDFVECGTWRGGSVMVMIETLKHLKAKRKIHIFDTFQGMTKPDNQIDARWDGKAANELLELDPTKGATVWAVASLEEVKQNLSKTGYPGENLNFVKGPVEETLRTFDINNSISLLRLDTDWYESTLIELQKLFPHLVKGGICIIDDYGHWEGCKKAVDEYFRDNQLNVFLNRIDYSGRLIVKP